MLERALAHLGQLGGSLGHKGGPPCHNALRGSLLYYRIYLMCWGKKLRCEAVPSILLVFPSEFK